MLMGLKLNMGWQTTISLVSTTCFYVSDRGNCRGFLLLSWLGILPLQASGPASINPREMVLTIMHFGVQVCENV